MSRNKETKEKRTEEKNELLKRMLVRKGVTSLTGLIGAEKVLGESGISDILDIMQDVPDIADVEESDK